MAKKKVLQHQEYELEQLEVLQGDALAPGQSMFPPLGLSQLPQHTGSWKKQGVQTENWQVARSVQGQHHTCAGRFSGKN